MTPEQIDIIVRAAQKLLTNSRDLMDYLSPLMPIAGAVIGWLAAFFQFRSSFRKNLEKEHYYASKEHVMEIVKLHSQFLGFFYQFHRSVKTVFNARQRLPPDALSDFITEYNFRLSEIHQLARIEFPGVPLDIRPTMELLKKVEDQVAEMDFTIADVLHEAAIRIPGAQPPAPPETAIILFNKTSKELIDGVIGELTKHENIMVQLLTDEATRLSLVAKPSGKAKKVPSN